MKKESQIISPVQFSISAKVRPGHTNKENPGMAFVEET